MRVAITGGIAEGKSTIIGYLSEIGMPTASADDIAREVFNSSETQAVLAGMFGLDLPIDSIAMRGLIQRDPGARRRLNAITHPRILSALKKSSAIFFEVPLLIESCLIGEFDRIWVATCGPEEQLRRLAQRVGNEPEAHRLIAMQLPTIAKTAFADEIVRTNRSEGDVMHFVQAAVAREIGG